MKKQHIKIKMADGVCDAYIASPDTNENLPAVLLYMDAFGPRERLFAMADRIASEGYFVLLPNVFYRMKAAPVVDIEKMGQKNSHFVELIPQIMPLIEAWSPEHQKKDAKDYLAFLRKETQSDKVGCVGYCMGGSAALRAAAAYPEHVQAVASYHAGRIGADTPNSVLKVLPQIKAEVYIAHADKDNSMPADQIERVRQTLDSAHVKFKAELYKEAEHGFTMSDHPAYNPRAEIKHWETLFDLFDRTLHL